MPSGVNWDDASRQQLLLIIIHLTAPALPKWEKVAELLNNGCTGEAARQQFKGLRSKAKKEFGELAPADNSLEEKPKTPAGGRSKKASGESATKSTGKRKAGKGAREAPEDGDESPTKKMKTESKDENGDDGEAWGV